MESNNMHVHNFKKVIIPSTCKTFGYTLHKCDCGYEHKESFKPIGEHTFNAIENVPPTCTEAGNAKMVCEICGEMKNEPIAPRGHDYSDWSVQTYPTCTGEGKSVRVCHRCGALDEKTIEATGHLCAKGTAQSVGDGMVEFFCENCGETVRCVDKRVKAKKRVKIISITTAILFVVAFLVLLIWKVVLPNYHYNLVKKYALAEEHDKAYEHYCALRKLSPESQRLEDFTVVFESYKYHNTYFSDEGETKTENQHNYQFDKYGNVTLDLFYQNGEVYWRNEYEYEYDENNNVVVKVGYDENRKIDYTEKFEYDKSGNKIRELTYDENGNLNYYHTYKYDRNGNLKKAIFYSERDTIITEYVYKYDDDGHLVSEIWYDSDGLKEREFEYDAKGNMLTQACFKENGDLAWRNTYKYKYNKRGEIKKETIYNEDGKIESESIIEYENPLVFYFPNE